MMTRVVCLLSAFAILSTWWPPQASADASDMLRAAVSAVRGAACAPLREDPIVRQAAEEINESNEAWIDHRSRARPVPDAMPLLNDLGYTGGTRSAILYGAGRNDADSIKALLLQGFSKLPDCSYTDFGASVVQSNSAGWILSVVVLAGAGA
jgi:hypothetical protein